MDSEDEFELVDEDGEVVAELNDWPKGFMPDKSDCKLFGEFKPLNKQNKLISILIKSMPIFQTLKLTCDNMNCVRADAMLLFVGAADA